jgi:hypothetical protein
MRSGITATLVLLMVGAYSQETDGLKRHSNHYTFTIGSGWVHNLTIPEVTGQNIQNDFATVSFEFFWVPEHRVSLGLGTGYHRIFEAKGVLTDNTTGQVDRSIVPLVFLVQMRIVDNVHLGVGTGIAFIHNTTVGGKHKVITNTASLSNFEFYGAYIYPLSKYWLLGGKATVYYIGNTEDTFFSLQVTCALKL